MKNEQACVGFNTSTALSKAIKDEVLSTPELVKVANDIHAEAHKLGYECGYSNGYSDSTQGDSISGYVKIYALMLVVGFALGFWVCYANKFC